MSISIPDYKAMSLAEIFRTGQSYSVPTYQRGYAWGEEQVEQLLQDLMETYEENPASIYLIGQSIVCESEDGQSWEIVDGQQRITTLYLMVTRMWHSLKTAATEFDFNDQARFGTLSPLILNVDQSGPGPTPRLSVAKPGQNFVNLLVQENRLPAADTNSTEENIRTAVEIVDDWMRKYFSDVNERFNFLWFVINKVIILRLELRNVREALQVFQKMNNRGLALDDADLLKNLLFINSDEDEFGKLSKSWDDASQAIFKARLKRAKSMEFLMKAMIGITTGQSVPTTKVFERWEERLQDKASTHEFATSLANKAKMVANASLMKSYSGDSIRETPGTYLFKWVQHLEVLLAGMHLDIESYRKLCDIVDTRAMLSMLAGEKNQDFERVIHKWSAAISKLPSGASRTEIIMASKDVLTDLDDLIDSMRREVPKLSYAVKTQQQKIRYCLTRIAQYVEMTASNVSQSNQLLFNLVDPDLPRHAIRFHLDHIFPKSERRRGDWPEIEQSDLIQSIGNLILLHPDDNTYQSDELPSSAIKKQNIGGSKLLINQALCPTNSRAAIAQHEVNALEALREEHDANLDNWGPTEILKRQGVYLDILAKDIRSVLSI
jgi:uncharacterized protein with PIN domain